MELDDLLELLEIDTPRDLSFFEQYAELAENEAEIPLDTFSALFEEVDRDTLAELTEAYFEDVLKYIPDDATDFFALFTTIGQALSGIALALDTEGNRQLYAEEFSRFRNWFLFDSEVLCTSMADDGTSALPVFKALALYRAEHLSDDEFTYDFTEALDYAIDEYMIPLNSLTAEDEDPEDRYDDYDEDEE